MSPLKIFCNAYIIEVQNKIRSYPAGVASPASLLTLRVRGCNEIYHLE